MTCIPMSSDVPHPAKVHWREVAKHDQLHCKTPRGIWGGTEGDVIKVYSTVSMNPTQLFYLILISDHCDLILLPLK